MPSSIRTPLIASAAALFAAPATVAHGAAGAEQTEFFESRIRPVLVAECYQCHAAGKVKGGLRLDWRGGWEKGGESGPAILPGNPEGSLLYRTLDGTHAEIKMPKDGAPLDARILADFHRWIAAGAADPRDTMPTGDQEAARTWDDVMAHRRLWWSFQPVRRESLPPVKDSAWSGHPVDRFLLAGMEAHDLRPAPPADAAALYRRLCYTLTGLPPRPEDTAAFIADPSPAAYDAAVTKLMDSPHFGERWARHWLDLVRYADTHGSEGDPEIPQAWRYRDYLIRAFNADVPLNRLIREHIAGDLMADPRVDKKGGINESAIGPAQFRLLEHGFQPVDTLDEQVRTIDNQIDVVTKSFLGLTMSCARCHDHKFDPVSQHDYFALYGVLASCRPAMTTVSLPSESVLNELRAQKESVRRELGAVWKAAAAALADPLRSPQSDGPEDAAPEAAALAWKSRGQHRPVPLAVWDFSAGTSDALTAWPAELQGGAKIENGRLVLDGVNALARTAPVPVTLGARTIEVFATVGDLNQRGGGVISVETPDGNVFDAIVFAEEEPRRWLAGSDFHRRTRNFGGPEEAAGPEEPVHLVMIWHADGTIEAWRNGEPCGRSYRPEGDSAGCRRYDAGGAHLLFGKRHTGGGNAHFKGSISSVRIYNCVLTPAQVKDRYAGRSAVLPPEDGSRLSGSERERLRTLRKTVAQERLHPRRKAASPVETGDHPLNLLRKIGNVADAEFPRAWGGAVSELRTQADLSEKAWSGLRAQPGYREESVAGWNRSGSGLKEPHPAAAGGFSIRATGETAVDRLLPAGWWTHLQSSRCNGVLTSPRFKVETDYISIRCAGTGGAQVRLIVDGYPLGTDGIFPRAVLKEQTPGWVKLNVNYRKGSLAYLEFTTLDDAARSAGDGGNNPDRRSFFGVERVIFHNSPDLPVDPPNWLPLLENAAAPESRAELASLISSTTLRAVTAWQDGSATAAQTGWLDALIRSGELPTVLSASPALTAAVTRWRETERQLPPPVRVPGLSEGEVINQALYVRGDHKKSADPVARAFPAVLGGTRYPATESGRRQLADDLVRPDNPLTPRVMANRIWHHLFGRGIVPTVDNFGRLGDQPVHPELLDWLALRLIDDGWSLKKSIRLLVTSKAWQMSSTPSPEAMATDPDNRWLSHTRVRRLEAESIRDSILQLAGKLNPAAGGPPAGAEDDTRRSLYLIARRTAPHPFLEVFDAAKPLSTQGRRDQTNVPAQSLTLLNDPFVIGAARAWEEQVRRGAPGASTTDFTRIVLTAAWGRTPSDAETERAADHLRELAAGRNAGENSPEIRADFIQSVMNSKEFIWLR